MPGDLEQERLRALRQAQRQLLHHQKRLDDQRTHTEEAIAFYKEKLIKTAEALQEKEAFDLVKKLIELRARLVAIQLKELKEEEVILDPKKTKRIIDQYHKDCLMLALATDKLLGIEHEL